MRSMLLAIAFAGAVSLALAQSPTIRASLDPSSKIIVGQPVHLVVEVLVPNFFTGEPDFPAFDLENAIVVLPDETPQNFNQQVGGQSFSGIRRIYFLYPQQAGDFRLPPAKIAVRYASDPPKTSEAHLTLSPLTFHAEIPIAAQGLSYFLPTARLTMQQRWSSPINKLRVGDVVERSITVTVDTMQGMLIPPLNFEAPEGIKVYPEAAKVQDQKTDRGEFVHGIRAESVKYFMQKEGDYMLPSVELRWWNLNTRRLVTTTIPSVHFAVAPNPDNVVELAPEAEPALAVPPKPVSFRSRYHRVLRLAPWILLALFSAYGMYRYFTEWQKGLREAYVRFRRSESSHFRNLVRACLRNQADEAYRNLLLWLEHAGGRSTLDGFLKQSEDDELTRQVNALTEALFAHSPRTHWEGRSMAKLLRAHRRQRSLRTRRRVRLPLLNPE